MALRIDIRTPRCDDFHMRTNEAMAELIVQGLVKYDPQEDACRWIGPEHGSPEYKARIKKKILAELKEISEDIEKEA